MSMLGSKKGQGMSLNTIIIAIIVLVVLVVLVLIFTGYFSKIFTPTVQTCSSKGGECITPSNTCSTDNGDKILGGPYKTGKTAKAAGCADSTVSDTATVDEICCKKSLFT